MSTPARLAAFALTAGAVVAPLTAAQPANAGVVGCTTSYVSIEEIRPADFVNCQMDTVGWCTLLFDPLESPAVDETLLYANCLVY